MPAISFGSIKFTIGDKPASYSFKPFPDSVGEAKAMPLVCGDRAYSVVEGYSFLKIKEPPSGQEIWSLEVFCDSFKQVGLYKARLAASLANYPSATAAVFEFEVMIQDPCLATKIEPTAQKSLSY